ncbi:MAG: dTMP kinase [Dehalococcoidales bacterium]|nr:MAG: dTMP kinase [Dehalococcoidales bacterium]
MALFITFEGGEGSGKTYQARALHRRLSKLAIPAVITREPGGTVIGERLARWLKWSQNTGITPLTELMAFNASRAQLVAEVIKPALESGQVVISDRYTDSTTAYQGYGRGLDLEMVKKVNGNAAQGLSPDVTFMLDLPVEEGLSRKGANKRDRFEEEEIAFHERVRAGYLRLAAEEPERWVVVDGNQAKVKIRDIVWQRVSPLL